MADPVSWLMIEPGWEVVDASGKVLGTVREVLGDEERDIWDGLRIGAGVYVPAERVTEIVTGRIIVRT